MLPILLYNNMDGGSNSLNNSSNNFGHIYDDNIIINSVRTRKKVSELPNCPVCSCTIRNGELETHLALEVERLNKLSSGSKRKLSSNATNLAVPGSSTSSDIPAHQDIDVTGCPGSDVYQRVHVNRLQRLRARRRMTPPPHAHTGECPVCNAMLPISRLQRHALRCLKRTGASMDEDIPNTSSEDESIDVENDEPEANTSGFGAEYQWCGQWRVRAAALQGADARPAVCVRRASNDHALVVDGDEDTELYGPPQYSPSRIAPDAEITQSEDTNIENTNTEDANTEDESDSVKMESDRDENNVTQRHSSPEVSPVKTNGLVEASAETRIQALKMRIRELENKQNLGSQIKCLICLGAYTSPAVSIQCWHVYCEVCWLQSLKAKKICPQCNAITTAEHLRRIYM